MSERDIAYNKKSFGLSEFSPRQPLPVLNVNLPANTKSTDNLIYRVWTDLQRKRFQKDNRSSLVTKAVNILERPQNYAFRTFYRNKEDDPSKHIKKGGLEYPIIECKELFAQIGGYDIAETYCLPSNKPKPYRAFEVELNFDHVDSYVVIYNARGLEYNEVCAAVKITDNQSFLDKLQVVIKVNWK